MWTAPEDVGGSPRASEQTFAELDHQDLLDGYAIAAQSRVVAAALPSAGVLLIARRGTAIRAAHLRDGKLVTDEQLAGDALRAVLLAIPDDDAIDEALAWFGARGEIDHAVVCDPDGSPRAFAAAFSDDEPLPAERTRATLARAAAAIGGWMRTPPTTPAHTLLEAVDEPAVIHEDGIALVVNSAFAALLGRSADDVVGTSLSRMIVGLPKFAMFLADVTVACPGGLRRFHARERTLVVGGRARRVLVLRSPDGLRMARTPAGRAVARACVRVADVVRRSARLDVRAVPAASVSAELDEVIDVLALALLDAATILYDRARTDNRITLRTELRPAEIAFEIVATGALAALRHPNDHLGSAACAARAALLGGRVEVETTETHTRTIRVLLPRDLP